MELGHRVGAAGEAQAHHRHVEALVGLVAGPVPELHELVEADAHLAGPRAEVALDQLAREAVDAGRHGRVGGEDARGPHRLDGLAVGEARVLHELADPLEAEEPGVALVGVEHLGVDAERVEGAHAADAEEDLLAEAVLGLAAVEPVGDGAQVGGVLLDVGVEQVQRHPTDLGLPHAGHERRAGQVDLDGDPVARREGHGVRVEVGVALLLPAVGGQRLAEVAVPVEEADADQRHAEVAARLEVVAGQHAEAAGVLGERLGDPELGGEVGDGLQRRVLAGLEPAIAVEVALVLVAHLAEEAHEAGVVDQRVEPLARHHAEHADRVVDRRVPRVGVDPLEHVAGLGVPRPAQVHGQLLERRQLGRQRRPDGEAAQGLHPGPRYPASVAGFPGGSKVRCAQLRYRQRSMPHIELPDGLPGDPWSPHVQAGDGATPAASRRRPAA